MLFFFGHKDIFSSDNKTVSISLTRQHCFTLDYACKINQIWKKWHTHGALNCSTSRTQNRERIAFTWEKKYNKQVTFCPSAFLSNQTQYATTLKYFQIHQLEKYKRETFFLLCIVDQVSWKVFFIMSVSVLDIRKKVICTHTPTC